MTVDVWPITGCGFNLLAIVCFWQSSLGNRGYASWVPSWMPTPFVMMLFVLPSIGMFCTIVSFIIWYKHRKNSNNNLPKDYSNWFNAVIVSGGCLVALHGWWWTVMHLL